MKSDHHNLKYFITIKKLSGQQIQQYEELSKYNYWIEHVSGKQNITADVLS